MSSGLFLSISFQPHCLLTSTTSGNGTMLPLGKTTMMNNKTLFQGTMMVPPPTMLRRLSHIGDTCITLQGATAAATTTTTADTYYHHRGKAVTRISVMGTTKSPTWRDTSSTRRLTPVIYFAFFLCPFLFFRKRLYHRA